MTNTTINTFATPGTAVLTASNVLFVKTETMDALFHTSIPRTQYHLTVVAACADGTFYPGLSSTWKDECEGEASIYTDICQKMKVSVGSVIHIPSLHDPKHHGYVVMVMKPSIDEGFTVDAFKSCLKGLMDIVKPLKVTSLAIALAGCGRSAKNLHWYMVIDAYMKVFRRMPWINVQIMASEGCIKRYPRIIVVDSNLQAHGMQVGNVLDRIHQEVEQAAINGVAPDLSWLKQLYGDIGDIEVFHISK